MRSVVRFNFVLFVHTVVLVGAFYMCSLLWIETHHINLLSHLLCLYQDFVVWVERRTLNTVQNVVCVLQCLHLRRTIGKYRRWGVIDGSITPLCF